MILLNGYDHNLIFTSHLYAWVSQDDVIKIYCKDTFYFIKLLNKPNLIIIKINKKFYNIKWSELNNNAKIIQRFYRSYLYKPTHPFTIKYMNNLLSEFNQEIISSI